MPWQLLALERFFFALSIQVFNMSAHMVYSPAPCFSLRVLTHFFSTLFLVWPDSTSMTSPYLYHRAYSHTHTFFRLISHPYRFFHIYTCSHANSVLIQRLIASLREHAQRIDASSVLSLSDSWGIVTYLSLFFHSKKTAASLALPTKQGYFLSHRYLGIEWF